ncbi:hypothetical protein [Nonomuraea rubra]|uniref:Uncharacterized protein n=1 Tax=Nonomuraea rubra TaxID=46180 RepID=A0A7X0TW95_9ACTN|nr:hypothetical protein [Nonomuraea rubra]MBB6545910.1 hypothetical protein [Nonomuraea rubra]
MKPLKIAALSCVRLGPHAALQDRQVLAPRPSRTPGKTKRDWERVESSFYRDTPESGKVANIKRWVKAGFRTADPASCNTWAAPSSKVS